ncbi:MAG: hypothetical protein V4616_09895 [Bacteroidota bacterium]
MYTWKYGGTPVLDNTIATNSPTGKFFITAGTGHDEQTEDIPVVAPGGGTRSLRLGNRLGDFSRSMVKTAVKITEEDFIISYKFALIMKNYSTHLDPKKEPYFRVWVASANTPSTPLNKCYDRFYYGDAASEGYDAVMGPNRQTVYKKWATDFIDLKAYIGQTVVLAFEVGDCGTGGDFTVAYIDVGCDSPFAAVPPVCYGDEVDVKADFLKDLPYNSYTTQWFFDGAANNPTKPPVKYNSPGTRDIGLQVVQNGCTTTVYTKVDILNCEARPPGCCRSNFSPSPGKVYRVSSWVMEDGHGKTTYAGPAIQVTFKVYNDMLTKTLEPSGSIIDGWQKIEEDITIPAGASTIEIELVNRGSTDVFFDDVRFHPREASLTSFVFDSTSKKLIAELDDNNFSTFYEYDEDGKLIRLKKETERGVKTIQESRSNLTKP